MSEIVRRPDPDALLALSDKEGEGKLRVFLGAAPGVGKSYAMLARARAAKAEGIDVAIGLVETHGRPETQALLEGLEVLPRRKIDYRGRTIEEFDIDAALSRKPKLILVDELAHTNAPDSRHPKRWQDVEELLDAGVDVWTALNIQHLESLADVVSRITGVAVRETVPDRVLQNAADVILVDITPDELLQRLKEGKVYVPETAQRATQNFFTARNITALRELALRRTAERVDDQMVEFLRQSAIEGPWATSERLLVCIGPDTAAEAIIRAGARLASGLNASWIALHVAPGGQEETDVEKVRRIDNALHLAERLGADVERLSAEELTDAILRFAQRENITQIVVGRSRAGALARLRRRSLTEDIVRRAKDVAVHVVLDNAGGTESASPVKRFAGLRDWIGQLSAIGAVALTVAVGIPLDRLIRPQNFSVIFLLPVLLCATRYGLWPAISAAILSFLAYDFFFVDPRYVFTISEPQEFISLLVSLVVAIMTGLLASRMRDHANALRMRAQATQSLFEFSRKLVAAKNFEELMWTATVQIQKVMDLPCVVFLTPRDGELAICAAWPPLDQLDAGENGAALWAFQKDEAAGWRTGTLPNVRFQFRPLATPRGVVAVCGVQPRNADMPFAAQEENALSSLLEQAAIAIDRSRLIDESVRAAALEQNEQLRTTLLSSLSHDLRTPLSTITAAVTSLRQLGAKLPESDRQDLLASIEEEAGRLARFIANLLDMSRIEAGGLAPMRELVDVASVVRGAIERIKKVHADQKTAVSIAPDLPAIRGDAKLLGQVLFNLLDNAHKYGGETGAIVHARREGDAIVISVTDEGPGIKPKDLERVFEKFYRGGRPDGRKAGTGLGLSICRGLVTAMGGSIVAQSPAVRRRGTRIVMKFPVADESKERPA